MSITSRPNLPYLAVLVMPTDINTVLDFYDRHFDEYNQMPPETFDPFIKLPIVRREGIDLFSTWAFTDVQLRHFGNEAFWAKDLPHGFVRISAPFPDRPLTLIEGNEGEVHEVHGTHDLPKDLGLETIEFRSFIEDPYDGPGRPARKCFFHSMSTSWEPLQNPRFVQAWEDLDHQPEGKPARLKFRQGGPVQPWEEPEFYQNRRIRDRFNRDIVWLYLERLGIPIERVFGERRVDRCVFYTDSP